MKKFTVTPYEVSGDVDYDKLTKEFGTEPLNEKILNRIKKHTKDLHIFLRRKIFFCHRDLNWLLDEYEKGNKFYLYTGRGPSGSITLGHLVPWIFAKWLQDKFDAKLYFQMTDDEKFLFKPDLTIEDTNKLAYDNALDVIALGFNPKKTVIFSDIDYAKTLYKQALRVAKKLTFSTAKATFGFTNESNVGQIFFTSMQSVPAFLESVKQGKNVPCLIPLGIDQDPHFRISRDILPKLGYYKPALIHSKFLPGLTESGKMSASKPETAIFTTDDEETVKRKIYNAFTGGGATLKEHKKLGGKSEVCSVFQYLFMLFEPDDRKIKEMQEECKSGKIICGECKKKLIERLNAFLKEHQKKRKEAIKKLNVYIIRD